MFTFTWKVRDVVARYRLATVDAGERGVKGGSFAMTLDDPVPRESGTIRNGMNTGLLVFALTLLIAGFPSLLFGVFLAISQGPDGIGGDVAFGFSFGGLISVLCSFGIRAYLRKRDGWF